LIASVVLPLAGAVGIALTGRFPNVREAVTLVTGCMLALVVWSLVPEVAEGARPSVLLTTLLGGIALAFEVEPLGMMFAALGSPLWIVTSLYSIGYMRGNGERNQTRFYVWFAMAISAALGVAFAANLFPLFVFYEVLTLSTY